MKKILTSILILTLSSGILFSQGSWSGMGFGPNLPVQTLTKDTVNNVLYAGGIFTSSGLTLTPGVARWNGSTWSPVGGGLLSGLGVTSMVMKGSDLIVGGSFTSIGGLLSKNVALWNGSSWLPLGSGLEYTGATTVSTLTIYNNDLYAGGTFSFSGLNAVNYIAKWNGSSWEDVGGGTNGSITSMCVFNGELYIGGTFTMAGGVTVKNIAKWNGSSWSDVGGGLEYTGATTVSTLRVFNNELYAGGRFTTAGTTVAVSHIAKWDGISWSDVGGGVSYTGATTVSTLQIHNGGLYVGGVFAHAGGIAANNIAKWDGTAWSALGSGTNAAVHAIESYGGKLIAGGSFLFAGGALRPFIAKWDDASSGSTSRRTPGEDIIQNENSATIGIYPNPATDRIFIQLENVPPDAVISFSLYDISGREVMQEQLSNGVILLDRTKISGGMYFYRITDADKTLDIEGRLVIE